MKMMVCAAYGCFNRSDKGKGKGISFFFIPNPRIKPEKEDLAASGYSTLEQDGQ